MAVPTENLDIKKEQLDELKLVEAYQRSNAGKSYEVVSAKNIQLPAPDRLCYSIRPDKQANICKQLRDREIHGTVIQENVVACLNPDISTDIQPTRLLPKAMNVVCHEKQHLQDSTIETTINRASWSSTNLQYQKSKVSEIKEASSAIEFQKHPPSK